MANRKRIPFSAAGPFAAVKDKPINGVPMERDKVYAADVFAGLHDRRLELLYEANWINMAPADYDGPVLTAADLDPLDHDGDGHKGGSLPGEASTAHIGAERRHEAEAEAETPPEAPETAQGAENPAEAAEDTSNAGEGAETAPDAAEAAAAPDGGAETAAAVIVAYRHEGFGKYRAVDAEGRPVGDTMAKAKAAGLAAQAGVPVLGQNEALPTKE
jgi:hypothetical protein